MLDGKKIIIAVCGSIAAYKSALLVRLLIKSGAEVKVLMTSSAKDFITPLTLSTLSKNPVSTEFIKNEAGEWENHVELGLWADVMVIAPASANTIAKMANGFCDNLLSAVYLSAKCPVMIAPAMDLDMYKHPALLANLEKLKSYDNLVLNASHGELASGLVGDGRMVEPDEIYKEIEALLSKKKELAGKQALVTAGPTYEQIDPVRFIGNNSSGKMGLMLAEELANRGAVVDLIFGPSNINTSHSLIKITRVKSADEMLRAVSERFSRMDISVFAAAVSDYKPASAAKQKIKKSDSKLDIALVKNKDIALEMGILKKDNQFNVGFALETENEVFHAQEKMKKKNFDMIVLNSLNDEGAGFSVDTNKVTILSVKEEPKQYDLKSKRLVAVDVVDTIIEQTSE
jgi:phosphopantothenoylcysteine decarboxylase/phosphopantothenate--cysteine ligase